MGRVPSRVAVTLSIPEGSSSSYAEVLGEAVRVKVEGAEVSGVLLPSFCIRRSVFGGLRRRVVATDRFADCLSAHFGKRVKMAWPRKFGELRVKGLVVSISS